MDSCISKCPLCVGHLQELLKPRSLQIVQGLPVIYAGIDLCSIHSAYSQPSRKQSQPRRSWNRASTPSLEFDLSSEVSVRIPLASKYRLNNCTTLPSVCWSYSHWTSCSTKSLRMHVCPGLWHRMIWDIDSSWHLQLGHTFRTNLSMRNSCQLVPWKCDTCWCDIGRYPTYPTLVSLFLRSHQVTSPFYAFCVLGVGSAGRLAFGLVAEYLLSLTISGGGGGVAIASFAHLKKSIKIVPLARLMALVYFFLFLQ